MTTWLDAARQVPVPTVARALGLDVRDDHRSFGPCPGCGVPTRANPGQRDKRGRCAVLHDGLGWSCFSRGSSGCGAKGSGPGLVKLALRAAGWSEVRAWYQSPTGANLPVQPPQPDRPPQYPPTAEVLALWDDCVRVDADGGVAGWLHRRGLVPAQVARQDLARALPAWARLPAWAPSWYRRGFRCLLPARDTRGEIKSLRARWVGTGEPPPAKAVPPTGYECVGLVLADGDAVGMLARGAAPARLVIAEGEPDFLTWATQTATLGVVSGAWQPSLAVRIPSGLQVIVRTHQDEAGELYARAITTSLAGRCPMARARGEVTI